MRLADLNALDDDSAVRAFLRCCGSSRWARRMAEARPFADADAMAAAADAMWWALDRPDWLEAFAAHPQIGSGGSGRPGGSSRSGGPYGAGRSGADGRSAASAWSDEEQAGVAAAADQTRRRLAEANSDYQARFGYIFIVCATGKTADGMLALLEGRLRHDGVDELRIAAEEQRKITRLRLTKLLEEEPDTP
jgi:2-oxo-4-hydroxy-4-carboxy-5-ureidoimidazoline decarboxylase